MVTGRRPRVSRKGELDLSKTIYISGPMSGIPYANYPAFNAAAAELRAQGYNVINPAEIEPLERTWNGFMRADLKALMDADTVVMLPGWEKSEGANLERLIASKLGMEILEYQEVREESA